MLARRTPSNTYTSRRRQRSASNPYPHLIPSSSPIKQLNQDDEDLPVEEMSRRMQKRSRVSMKRSIPGSALVKSASVGTSPLDGVHDEAPPSKKKRTGTREPLATLKAPGSNTQEATTDSDEILDMDITSIAQLKTPVPRENIIEPGKPDTVANEEADSLSPLPTSLKAKRVIAHRSNSNLKENSNRNMIAKGGNPLATSLLDDLDSPFHSRPGSPNTSRPPLSKSWNKSLNRTRSVGTDLRRRATLRSHSRAVSPASNTSSPGTRRHPSQPTSRMNLRQENKAWLVPAQFKPGIGQKTPRRPSDAAIPFIRESSFFESTPDACSTPLNKQNGSRLTGCYIDFDATPRLPLTLRPTTPVNKQDFCGIDDPTPRASIVNGPSIYSKDSLISSVHSEKDANDGHSHSTKVASERMRRRVAVHYSQDSIFSSALDFSMTAPNLLLPDVLTPPKNADVTVAPPSSPAPVSRKTSPASLGDDLRDMFSTLGLNGNTPIVSPGVRVPLLSMSPKRRSSLTAKQESKQVVTCNEEKGVSGAGRRKKRTLIKTKGADSHLAKKSTKSKKRKPNTGQKWTRPVVKTDLLDKPLVVASDSSDELDLFKKGKDSSADLIKFFNA